MSTKKNGSTAAKSAKKNTNNEKKRTTIRLHEGIGKFDPKTNTVTEEESDLWSGRFPTEHGYLRSKAALTGIAFPLIDHAKIKMVNGRACVSFPVTIKLPPTFTEDEVKVAICDLASY